MQFTKRDLQDLVYHAHVPHLTIIQDEITGTDRWSIHHELIFSFDEKLYRTDYSIAATEMQDERPFEYEPDLIECEEMVRKEVTRTIFVKKLDDTMIDFKNK